jgi:hypothetical protein
MDTTNSVEIDSIQVLFKLNDRDKNNCLKSLLGREIRHFVLGRAKVNSVNTNTDEISGYSGFRLSEIQSNVLYRETE